MSLKIYDFECTNTGCEAYHISYELITDTPDAEHCAFCNQVMARLMPAPFGRVSSYEIKNSKRRG